MKTNSDSPRLTQNKNTTLCAARREWLLVAALVLLAAGLRFYHLSSLPRGLHGDEAIAGMEAARILREGNIGPYSPLALGQPTGPLYLNALPQWLFGNTILAVRIVPAFLGVLSVPALFYLVRRHFDYASAVVAAGLLAVLGWHLHFSRVGFPLVSWPLCVVLATWALFEAITRKDWRWWAGAGAMCGLGIYSYNAHLLFIGVELVFIVGYLCFARETPGRKRCGWLMAYLAALLLFALPMARFALNPDNHYFQHSKSISITSKPEWQALGARPAQARFLAGRYVAFWKAAIWSPETDWVDGSGAVPLMPWPLALPALVGAAFGIWRRRLLCVFAICVILVMPVASAITVEGVARRPFALAPFVILLAAIGVVEIYRLLAKRGVEESWVAKAALGLWCIGIGYSEVNGYFGVTTQRPEFDMVYCRELGDAIAHMKQQPPGTYNYFLSDRWSINYEPRQYLAPEVQGEDRSAQFGRPSLEIDGKARPLSFILLGVYRYQIDALQLKYPGGRVVQGEPSQSGGSPTFIAYELR